MASLSDMFGMDEGVAGAAEPEDTLIHYTYWLAIVTVLLLLYIIWMHVRTWRVGLQIDGLGMVRSPFRFKLYPGSGLMVARVSPRDALAMGKGAKAPCCDSCAHGGPCAGEKHDEKPSTPATVAAAADAAMAVPAVPADASMPDGKESFQAITDSNLFKDLDNGYGQ